MSLRSPNLRKRPEASGRCARRNAPRPLSRRLRQGRRDQRVARSKAPSDQARRHAPRGPSRPGRFGRARQSTGSQRRRHPRRGRRPHHREHAVHQRRERNPFGRQSGGDDPHHGQRLHRQWPSPGLPRARAPYRPDKTAACRPHAVLRYPSGPPDPITGFAHRNRRLRHRRPQWHVQLFDRATERRHADRRTEQNGEGQTQPEPGQHDHDRRRGHDPAHSPGPVFPFGASRDQTMACKEAAPCFRSNTWITSSCG